MEGGPLVLPEPGESARRWARRAATFGIYTVLGLAMVLGFPLLLAAALLVDLVRPRRFVLVRCVLAFALYLGLELVGLAAAFALWLWPLGRERFLERNRRLQTWWGSTLFRGACQVFGMTLDVRGLEAVGPGPMLVFARHASTVDTVLPTLLLARERGIALRFVLKRELLWDPCLDVVGNRLPNYFVRRGSGEGQREIAAIERLARDLGPGEGVMIYPEGTRFTPAKLARARERIRSTGDADRIASSERIGQVMPPRLGGPLGLLAAQPDADVVFLVHAGLEGARGFDEFFQGGLIGARVEVELWRVPATEIPRDLEGRKRWLLAQWERVDAFVTPRVTATGMGRTGGEA